MTDVVKRNKDGSVWLLKEPDDHFTVVVDGEEVLRTTVLSAAEIYFNEAVEDRLAATRELRARERAHYDLQAVRSDSFARRAASARKTGGKGGRGGV